MPDVTISYKGSTIATMASSGTKTLETAGTYCEDDITIDYTKTGITVTETLDSHGGTIVSISGDPVTSLQAKTVIPTSQSQTISADSGYDAISEVLVQGDSNLISSNIASGVSIFGVVGTFAGGGGDLKAFIEQHGTITSFTDNTISIIGDGAFFRCGSLSTVAFSSCTSIGVDAFYSCKNLTTISFPICTYVGPGAFKDCRWLTEANFPNCTGMGGQAFYGCSSLITANFPVCTNMGDSVFYSCSKLINVNFPKCESIGAYGFASCYKLESASFSSVTVLDANAFANCRSLTTISLPNCSKISTYAFYSCSILATASFPACTYIDQYAFAKCYHLISLYLLGSSIPLLFNSTAFSSSPIGGYTTSTNGVYGSIFVPSSLYSAYITSTNWTHFSSRFVSM